MTIGEKIKFYRQKCGITQEKLASELNISFQAVSKWERGECLPDVSVIGHLADVLGITCDTLLTDNGFVVEQKIEELLQKTAEANVKDHGEYMKIISILEEAVEKYPRSYKLMTALAEAYSKGAGYPEFREKNYQKRSSDIYEYIAANCPDVKLRYQTIQMLCYLYRGLEKYERIKELAETMPELYQTRPALIYHSMPGDSINTGIHDYYLKLLDSAESMLTLLIYPNKNKDDEEKFDALRKRADNRELWNNRE